VRPSDPTGPALDAFAQVVENLGWSNDVDQIVFAHTHQPLADARPSRGGRVRYWNTGSWIYEPDVSSYDAYVSYLQKAWPGTAVLIDTDEPSPRLLQIRRRSSCSTPRRRRDGDRPSAASGLRGPGPVAGMSSGGLAHNAAAALRWREHRALQRFDDVVGGPARRGVIVMLACVLALDSADKATVGAVGVQLERGLHIGNAGLGLLVAVTSIMGGLGSIPAGGLVTGCAARTCCRSRSCCGAWR